MAQPQQQQPKPEAKAEEKKRHQAIESYKKSEAL